MPSFFIDILYLLPNFKAGITHFPCASVTKVFFVSNNVTVAPTIGDSPFLAVTTALYFLTFATNSFLLFSVAKFFIFHSDGSNI